MESIFDLPTHVLAVHAAVVLQPLLALITVVVMVRPRWRRRFAPWLAAALVVVLLAVFVAMRTGEAFDELLDGLVDVSKHESLAETTRNLMLGWLVALLGLVVIDRRLPVEAEPDPDTDASRRDRGALTMRLVAPGMAVVVAVLAVLATIWMIRTGHEGARVTWSGVIEQQRG